MKKIQDKVRDFCKDYNLESPPEHRVLDLLSELGEVAKEVLKMSDYGRKPIEFGKEIESELGDTLFSLITLANQFDVDLEDALEIALAKYQKRLQKGSAGSECD